MFVVQPLSQMDPQWKDIKIGLDSATTIGRYGCLLADMTMVANGYGYSETPASLNDKMKEAGGFQGSMIIPAMLPTVLPNIRFRKYQPCENYPAPLDEIDAALAAGNPAIVEVDYSPAPGMQNHWVILLAKKGSDYIIQDPWPYPAETKTVLLTKRFGFAGDPQEIIKGVIWFESAVPQPPPTPTPPTPIIDTGFSVYSTVDGLALRSQPLVADDTLIKRIPLQGKLFVTESAAKAKPKIGQVGQWLKVQDTQEGYLGYVAAWYVSTTLEMTPPPAPRPPPPPAPQPLPTPPPVPQPDALIVYVTMDGLALRNNPLITDATLIKRLPVNAQFVAQEPTAQALAKLGVTGQWIQVRDVEGMQGYTAAWYLSQYRQEALGVKTPNPNPPPAPPPTHLIVRANEDNLALRSQPLIDSTTLIKRYPLLTEFLVLEPVDQAVAKLGAFNQWLNVRAIDGQEGYLAAWYVTPRPPVGG